MSEKNSERFTLPVLPLRQMVLFPGVTVPVGAGRPGTLRAIEAALKTEDRLIFAVTQRENVEVAEPSVLFEIGTVARISQVQRGLGGMQIILEGQYRASSLQVNQKNRHLTAVVHRLEDIDPPNPSDPSFQALHKEVRERGRELGIKSGIGDDVVHQVLESVSAAGAFADFVAGYLDVSTRERQSLLEVIAVEDRLRAVLLHVQRQIELLDVQEDIKSQVQEELGQRQREMYLREQLKAIHRELGDEEEAGEVDELRERLDSISFLPETRDEINRELRRLERMPRESAEAQGLRAYLEAVAELPWDKRSDETLDIADAQRILDADHFGLADVKDRILEFLAVRKLRQGADPDREETLGEATEERSNVAPILLFGGPPGVGKTSIAKSIAQALGRKYVRISLGGARDEADIRGHRRTYVGAMPGRIIQGLRQAGTKNPVILLDEVDKLGVSMQGDPAAALLEVLDPAQNHAFVDHYLGIPFDLSEVLFIATANFVHNIPAPLFDRMEPIEFTGYTEAEKLAIAEQYLVPRQLRGAGIPGGQVEVQREALSSIISGYTREAGVRQLERQIGKVARKLARKIAEQEHADFSLSGDQVRALLGRPKVHPENAAPQDRVGISTGMYYTPAGGDIMFVEVSIMEGSGDLILTGQLGDVMKESARAALTFAKSHARELGIEPYELQGKDVHIHVPAGAVPKDGPSAGVTMATALVSALSGIPVRHDLAMTGEITLSGRVMPIGGLKEKILGAVRAGISRIVLPKDNLRDLEDLRDDERALVKVFAAETLDDVLAAALRRLEETPLFHHAAHPEGLVYSEN